MSIPAHSKPERTYQTWLKGRKERTVPLWHTTAKQIRLWLRQNQFARDHPLFPNRTGGPMTRTGVTDRLKLAAATAACRCPQLKKRRVSPHIVRHYLPFLTMSCPAAAPAFDRLFARSSADIVLTPCRPRAGEKGVHYEVRYQQRSSSVARTRWPARGTHWRVCPITERAGVCPQFDSPAGSACCGFQPLAEATGSRFTSCQL